MIKHLCIFILWALIISYCSAQEPQALNGTQPIIIINNGGEGGKGGHGGQGGQTSGGGHHDSGILARAKMVRSKLPPGSTVKFNVKVQVGEKPKE